MRPYVCHAVNKGGEPCGHVWMPRHFESDGHGGQRPVKPDMCPRCKSRYWDKPRTLHGHLEALAEGDPATVAEKGE